MNIYFIRHPQTENNKNNIWNGICESKLSSDGIKQSSELVKILQDLEINYIFSSPLLRCLNLAKSIQNQNHFQPKLIIDKRLIERNFGKLQDHVCNQQDKILLADWNANSDLNLNVEKIRDMYEQRIKPFINQITNDYKTCNVLIVSHSWAFRLLNFYFSNEKDNKCLFSAPKFGVVTKWVI